jgi:hypothetical protein
MNLMQSQLANAGLFFLFIFLSGFWLNRRGRPYGVIIVTVHKLIGLAAGIYLGLIVYRIYKVTPLSTAQIATVVVTVLFFAVNVATGSLLSTNKAMPGVVSLINKWFPYLTLVSTIFMIFLLA